MPPSGLNTGWEQLLYYVLCISCLYEEFIFLGVRPVSFKYLYKALWTCDSLSLISNLHAPSNPHPSSYPSVFLFHYNHITICSTASPQLQVAHLSEAVFSICSINVALSPNLSLEKRILSFLHLLHLIFTISAITINIPDFLPRCHYSEMNKTFFFNF